MHGFALNICPNLTGFEQILPCGLTRPVGSMAEFVPVELAQVQQQVVNCFAEVFNLDLLAVPE